MAAEGVALEEPFGETLAAGLPEGVTDRVAFTVFVGVEKTDALAIEVELTELVMEGAPVVETVAPGVPVYEGVPEADLEGEPEAELDTVPERTPLCEGLPELVLLTNGLAEAEAVAVELLPGVHVTASHAVGDAVS